MSETPVVQKTVLIVEDDNEVRGALERRLINAHYRVFSAGSGSEALSLAEQHRPDAITLDVRLPDIDGVEVADRLRSSEQTASIPVIFVTGHVDSHVREAAHWLGATFFLRKPYDPELLIVALERAMGGSDEVQDAPADLVSSELIRTPPAGHGTSSLREEDISVFTPPFEAELDEAAAPNAVDAFRMFELADDLTHDARSILFVISELTSLVGDGLGGEEHTERKRLLRVVRDRTAELKQLFDMLLAGAKLQADLLRHAPEEIPLPDFLKLVVSDCKRQARRRNCIFECSVEQDLPDFGGDVELARIALLSLLSHVVHSAEHESAIHLRACGGWHRGAPVLRFLLEARARLQPQRGLAGDLEWEQTRRGSQLGSGPKLALAAALARLNGGKVSIEGDRRQMAAELLVPMAETAVLI